VLHPHSTQEQIDELLETLKGKEKIALRSQTTLAVSDLSELADYVKEKRPDLNLPKKSDICYATENRQTAVVETITDGGAELMIIFGSDETKRQPSSNSIRLREVSESRGVRAHVVEDIGEVKAEWFDGISRVGVSAGASANPKRVAEFLQVMRNVGVKDDQILTMSVAEESQVFADSKDFDFRNS
jgi:4-hydroxy-3-methylbut-2-enyl diphosphate reductase